MVGAKEEEEGEMEEQQGAGKKNEEGEKRKEKSTVLKGKRKIHRKLSQAEQPCVEHL